MSRKVLACVGRECGRETRRLGARHWDIRKRSPCGVVSNYFPRGPGLIAFAPLRFMNLILFDQPFESIRLMCALNTQAIQVALNTQAIQVAGFFS